MSRLSFKNIWSSDAPIEQEFYNNNLSGYQLVSLFASWGAKDKGVYYELESDYDQFAQIIINQCLKAKKEDVMYIYWPYIKCFADVINYKNSPACSKNLNNSYILEKLKSIQKNPTTEPSEKMVVYLNQLKSSHVINYLLILLYHLIIEAFKAHKYQEVKEIEINFEKLLDKIKPDDTTDNTLATDIIKCLHVCDSKCNDSNCSRPRNNNTQPSNKPSNIKMDPYIKTDVANIKTEVVDLRTTTKNLINKMNQMLKDIRELKLNSQAPSSLKKSTLNSDQSNENPIQYSKSQMSNPKQIQNNIETTPSIDPDILIGKGKSTSEDDDSEDDDEFEEPEPTILKTELPSNATTDGTNVIMGFRGGDQETAGNTEITGGGNMLEPLLPSKFDRLITTSDIIDILYANKRLYFKLMYAQLIQTLIKLTEMRGFEFVKLTPSDIKDVIENIKNISHETFVAIERENSIIDTMIIKIISKHFNRELSPKEVATIKNRFVINIGQFKPHAFALQHTMTTNMNNALLGPETSVDSDRNPRADPNLDPIGEFGETGLGIRFAGPKY